MSRENHLLNFTVLRSKAVSRLIFPDFIRDENMVRVSEGKLYKNDLRGQKLLRVSGRFEFSRVRVTEGKITVNV